MFIVYCALIGLATAGLIIKNKKARRVNPRAKSLM